MTGANSGVGFGAALTLAGMGARVVLACRNESKAQEAKRRIIEETGNESVEVEILDCGSFKSIRNFIDRWGQRESTKIDILINNAGKSKASCWNEYLISLLGVLSSSLTLTEDGFEQTYHINHLSHVLLTHALLNQGWLAPDARIVSVSSAPGFHSSPAVDGSDVLTIYQNQIGAPLSFFDMMDLYSRSKAAQAVWTMALQRRLSQNEGWKGMSAHSCNPG